MDVDRSLNARRTTLEAILDVLLAQLDGDHAASQALAAIAAEQVKQTALLAEIRDRLNRGLAVQVVTKLA